MPVGAEGHRLTWQLFANHWDYVPTDLKSKLLDILLGDIETSVAHDVEKKSLNLMLTCARKWNEPKNAAKVAVF